MARVNVALETPPVFNHEGAKAARLDPYKELRRSVLTCLLWENGFYEKGSDVAARIAELAAKVAPEKVAALAIEARENMLLRHVPLFLVRELARRPNCGALVAATLESIIQRADELSEFVAMYWKDKRQPLSAGVKRGLAAAFRKFDAYRLAKYNRDSAVKLRDVMFLVNPKPKDEEQATTWKKLAENTLESPDTWEVQLSAGKDKKETFERLLREKKLGGLAVLRNLRNMQQAGVDAALISERLDKGIERALPFRFVTAAKHVPAFEPLLETAMFRSIEGFHQISGSTGLLIDVSGSMDYRLGNHGESSNRMQQELMAQPSETSRIDVAAALAILIREKCANARIATFSTSVIEIPARRGFALRDAISNSQPHGGTHLAGALNALRSHWKTIERLIVITDEQSQDGITEGWASKSYLINVASNKNGVGYGNGWTHIDGWSEHVMDYIREIETDSAAV